MRDGQDLDQNRKREVEMKRIPEFEITLRSSWNQSSWNQSKHQKTPMELSSFALPFCSGFARMVWKNLWPLLSQPPRLDSASRFPFLDWMMGH